MQWGNRPHLWEQVAHLMTHAFARFTPVVSSWQRCDRRSKEKERERDLIQRSIYKRERERWGKRYVPATPDVSPPFESWDVFRLVFYFSIRFPPLYAVALYSTCFLSFSCKCLCGPDQVPCWKLKAGQAASIWIKKRQPPGKIKRKKEETRRKRVCNQDIIYPGQVAKFDKRVSSVLLCSFYIFS